jgi:hypothetical protein
LCSVGVTLIIAVIRNMDHLDDKYSFKLKGTHARFRD